MPPPQIWNVWARQSCFILTGAIAMMGSGSRAEMIEVLSKTSQDTHSCAGDKAPWTHQIEHVTIDLDVDFQRKVIRGETRLRFQAQADPGVRVTLLLDARGLKITSVEAYPGTPAAAAIGWTDGPERPIVGRKVEINVPIRRDLPLPEANRREVLIRYETAPDAGALQWLDPAQTTGGKKPFLFTQSEAIQARTWLPIQDSPGVRVTYDATIRVPPGLTAVMAADSVPGNEPNTFRFRMDKPIPAYLIALAVGDLEFRKLGERTGVWAEPPVVDKAAHEFAETEAMIAATEVTFGPYRWGRYDLLVLPASFPFGGMENPKLTFATPTVLAGDRSLVALVAHELAHSWSGNLVTNATWNDFWLNEGFTVYLERRIVEAVYGIERRRMEDVLGIGELRADLARLEPRDQKLKLDLAGRDPDDGMNQVAYEKGALFLIELERVFGRDKFDSFLRGYFDHFAFRSITTEEFEAYLQEHLLKLHPELARQINVAAWIHDPGLNTVKFVEPTSPRLDAVDAAAKGWAAGRVATKDLPAAAWTTQEWLQFLRTLPAPLDPARMADLDAAFHLTDRQNAEVAGQWLLMAAQNGYQPAAARIESFLSTVGRRKFIIPIYRALIATPAGRERARAIYAKARPFYHPIAAESVDKLLKQ